MKTHSQRKDALRPHKIQAYQILRQHGAVLDHRTHRQSTYFLNGFPVRISSYFIYFDDPETGETLLKLKISDCFTSDIHEACQFFKDAGDPADNGILIEVEDDHTEIPAEVEGVPIGAGILIEAANVPVIPTIA